MWWRGWMQRPVEDTGVLAIILGLVRDDVLLTVEWGWWLASPRDPPVSIFQCVEIYLFTYLFTHFYLCVCVCTSSTPLEPSSLGSDTCRKKRVAGRTGITRVCLCCWLRNPKGEMTPAQQQRETGQFHGLESHRGIRLRYKRLLSHLRETIQELEFPIRKKQRPKFLKL